MGKYCGDLGIARAGVHIAGNALIMPAIRHAPAPPPTFGLHASLVTPNPHATLSSIWPKVLKNKAETVFCFCLAASNPVEDVLTSLSRYKHYGKNEISVWDWHSLTRAFAVFSSSPVNTWQFVAKILSSAKNEKAARKCCVSRTLDVTESVR